MSQLHYTTKSRKFKHISEKQRIQIELLLKLKKPKSEIAKIVGISRSTLYEELARGTVEQIDTNLVIHRKYFADVGQRVYMEHRQNSRNPLKLVKAHEFIEYAEEQMLKEKLSPDAIYGRAKLEGKFDEMVCTKTLYNYIDQCLLKVRNIDLPLRVKLNKKVRKDRINRRILGDSIETRPNEVNSREEFGHWEIDTIVGTVDTAPVLLTLDERMARRRHIFKINSRSSAAVGEALQKLREMYGDDFSKVFKSITSDNGSEFAKLAQQLPDVKIYFAHPYSSFERGTNEKQNSLVRRFFPKGKSFVSVSDEAVACVEDWINNLPRKIFNYHSALEIFNSVRFDIAIEIFQICKGLYYPTGISAMCNMLPCSLKYFQNSL